MWPQEYNSGSEQTSSTQPIFMGVRIESLKVLNRYIIIFLPEAVHVVSSYETDIFLYSAPRREHPIGKLLSIEEIDPM